MPRRVHNEPFILRPPDDLLESQSDLRHAANKLARAYRHMGDDFMQANDDSSGSVAVVSEDGLRRIGEALWDALVAADPTLPERLDEALAAAGTWLLPLIVESDVAAVQTLPWETLHHPQHGFLGQESRFTLSRRFPDRAANHPPDLGPLRVVMFTSLPDDVDPEHGRLDVEEQQAQALEAFGPAIADGRVDLRMPDDGRFATFKDLIHKFDPHLVFLFAHGKFVDEPGQTEPAYAIIQFENLHGGSDLVHDEAIAAAFHGTGTRAVVLAACESGMGDSAQLAMGLAGAIGRAGVPHVLGMRESILVRAGIAFNTAFADAVVAGERVDVAAQLARAAITRPLAGIEGINQATAELSLGQWPLPALISPDPAAPLIDWAFTPRPPAPALTSDSLGQVVLPPRFIGRRSELRDWKAPLLAGDKPVLLISGVGGRGKTALAGKIAGDWQRESGRPALVWSAHEGAAGWDGFSVDLAQRAGETEAQALASIDDERQRSKALLELILRREGGRLLVFLDNLETVQDPKTLEWTDDRVAAFVAAAHELAEARAGLRLLLTSRARPPDWPAAAHLPLGPVTFGDFLQLAMAQRAPAAFYQPGRARRVYDTLDGNARGLEFVAGALAGLDPAAEDAFLGRLRAAEAAMREDIALAELIGHLDDGTRALLARLPAYETAVPVDGIRALALDLPEVTAALDRLLAVGLVERYDDVELQTLVYRVAPAAAAWLAEQPGYALEPAWLRAAADYLRWIYEHERPTLGRAIILHRALARAGEQAAADEFALDQIVHSMRLAGLHRALLAEWLPGLRESAAPGTRARALYYSGLSHHHLGEYDVALGYYRRALAIQREIGHRQGEEAILSGMAAVAHAHGEYDAALHYLEKSLAIQREIGDRAGEGATLNNMGSIAHARGDYDDALHYLEQSLAIRREIGDRKGEGTTLNNIAQIYDAREEYFTALDLYKQSLAIQLEIGDRAGEGATLNNMAGIISKSGIALFALALYKQSLAIRREIGDTAGTCATLFNMGHVYAKNEQFQEALAAWVEAYQIASRIGEAQTLAKLEELAKQIGLPGGLAGWKALSEGKIQAQFTKDEE